MRKFKLFNNDESSSFNLYGGSILVTDVSGLGLNYDITDFSIKPEFEDITLNLTFGYNGNAYNDHSLLLNFIVLNGYKEMVLEYELNSNKIYCNIIAKKLPKSQKNSSNVITENFVFKRTTHWYKTKKITINEGDFSNKQIINNFIEPYPTKIIFYPITEECFIFCENSVKNYQVMMDRTLVNQEKLTIDGLNEFEKKVIYFDGTKNSNGYSFIDHGLNTFIYFQPGINLVRRTQGASDTGLVEIFYREWVI